MSANPRLPAPRLVVKVPGLQAASWELAPGCQLVAGRAGDIKIDASDVSRRHAELRSGTDGVWITDLGSRNGTTVNGTLLTEPVVLSHSDVVAFGSVWAVYEVPLPVSGFGPPPPMTKDFEPIQAPYTDGWNQTTRYLSAATQLDPEFRDLVIDRVIEEPYRALAPSYGVDLVVVTRWALSARRRLLVRDVVLVADLLLTLVLCAVLRPWTDPVAAPRLLLPVVAFGLINAWLVVAVERCTFRFEVLQRHMTRGRFRPEDAPEPLGRRIRERLRIVAERPLGNLLVFTDFWPFAGSGFKLDTWSFAIDVAQGAPDGKGGHKTPRDFSSQDVHKALTRTLTELGLPGQRVFEKLFVSGLDVRRYSAMMLHPETPPLTTVGLDTVQKTTGGPGEASRAYVCLEAPAWSGQMVITMFIRVVRIRSSLFLEWAAFGLPPLSDRFFAVDTLPPRSPAGAVSLALASATRTALPDLLRSPFRVSRDLRRRGDARQRRRKQTRHIRSGYVFDYGAYPSIREEATGDDWRRYFVELDQTMYLQVTQQRLLKAIGTFLDEHDIDLSEFAQHQNVINNDYSVRTGDVINSAVGGAHARVKNQPGRKQPSPTAKPPTPGPQQAP
ncbi:FHA domain-containing protein [Streptomyces olivoreticuli]